MKFNVAIANVTLWEWLGISITNKYFFTTQTLENVQSAKYLGINFTDNMEWGQHYNTFLFQFSNKMLVLRAGTHKMHVRIAVWIESALFVYAFLAGN